MESSNFLTFVLSFLFSPSGLLTLGGLALLLALLYSDVIKRHWSERTERKKWEYWNGPKKGD